MKVPTYHKYGLTKAGIEKSELRDRKISDILTHHLTIGIGSALGILVYILNYSKVQPSTFIQAVMQVFLFASMGVLCVGIPAVLFKLSEMFYFKYISSKSKEKQKIKEYQEERDEFDFWRIRQDYSFWRVMDGLSFEREVINVYMHLGYAVNQEQVSDENPYYRIIEFGNKNFYVSFNTSKELTETDKIDKMQLLIKEKNCESSLLFSQKGFSHRVIQHAKEKPIELYDINRIIKLVRTIKNN